MIRRNLDAPPRLPMSPARAIHLCRSWLFVPGGDDAALHEAPASGADVLVQELEDFTPPAQRPRARTLAPGLFAAWRAAGRVAAVRINPLETEGRDDLVAVMRGVPDIVGLPKVGGPEQVHALDEAVTRLELEYGLPVGRTLLWPNVESARGLVQTGEIARASPRVAALLLAAEDLAADLGAERGRDQIELAYPRQRFLVECVAAGVPAVDCPYTWEEDEGVERDTRWARRLGYKAKSVVAPEHAAIVNRVLTPSEEEIARARIVIAAFESARNRGDARAEFAGSLVEVPVYLSAQRLLARARELGCL